MYHRDLFADFFRERLTCDELMGFIDQLPRRSRLGSAIAEDDDLAELMENTPVSADGSTIPFTEWSTEVQFLAEVVDRLNTLTSVVSSALGSRVDLPRADRPVSAVERLRNRRGDELVAELEKDIAGAYLAWLDEHDEGV